MKVGWTLDGQHERGVWGIRNPKERMWWEHVLTALRGFASARTEPETRFFFWDVDAMSPRSSDIRTDSPGILLAVSEQPGKYT